MALRRPLVTWLLAALVGLHLAAPSEAGAQAGDDGPAETAVASADAGWSIWGRPPKEPLALGSILYAVHPFIDTSKYELISDARDGAYVRSGQLFLAGFLGELVTRNAPGRNHYLLKDRL